MISESIELAKSEITHGCDGPLTPFVLISRACELMTKGLFSRTAVSNALYEALEEYGWLKKGLVETGS